MQIMIYSVQLLLKMIIIKQTGILIQIYVKLKLRQKIRLKLRQKISKIF